MQILNEKMRGQDDNDNEGRSPGEHRQPLNVEKLPQTYGEFLQATSIGEPINTQGEIFRTVARLKLEH